MAGGGTGPAVQIGQGVRNSPAETGAPLVPPTPRCPRRAKNQHGVCASNQRDCSARDSFGPGGVHPVGSAWQRAPCAGSQKSVVGQTFLRVCPAGVGGGPTGEEPAVLTSQEVCPVLRPRWRGPRGGLWNPARVPHLSSPGTPGSKLQ